MATSSGKGENIKGRAKQAAGSITGNKKMEAEGAVERAKGAAKEKLHEAEEKEEEQKKAGSRNIGASDDYEDEE